MATLKYDYAVAYDSTVEYDQVNGPEVPYIGVEQTSQDGTSAELATVDRQIDQTSGPDLSIELGASDLPITLDQGTEAHLEVEGRP